MALLTTYASNPTHLSDTTSSHSLRLPYPLLPAKVARPHPIPPTEVPILTIEDVGRVEAGLFLFEHLSVEDGSVTHLIIRVHHAAIQQNKDGLQEVVAGSTKLGQACHCS